ncbi:hypothetical protein OIO90_002522 [Microbotryomycetes sp. JL221]|nr:hypothetical protein OIO90_002522 [Microbotryomycetes sp. JL221]
MDTPDISPAVSGNAGATASSSMTLTPALMSSFKPARVFNKTEATDECSFTSLAFDDQGQFAIAAAEDESLYLLDAQTGIQQKVYNVEKYGARLVRFTHSSSAILHTSAKDDVNIRYMSLHDNKYLRTFKGHKQPIVSMAMSPKDDTFLSGAVNDTVKLWDLRQASALGSLDIANHPSVAYDPSGMVFAVGLNLNSSISMYDRRQFDSQPFLTPKINDMVIAASSTPHHIPVITSLSFSNDGNCLLVGTSGDVHYVLDAFDGNVMARLVSEEPVSKVNGTGPGLERAITSPHVSPIVPVAGISGEEVTWSPDGRFIISGSIDGKINIWDFKLPETRSESGSPFGPTYSMYPIKTLDAHANPSRVVKFNPKKAMFASAGHEIAFWLPDLSK